MGLKAKLKAVWAAMDQVPNCPCCRGAGVSERPYENDLLWWRGQQVRGCYHCSGTGKV